MSGGLPVLDSELVKESSIAPLEALLLRSAASAAPLPPGSAAASAATAEAETCEALLRTLALSGLSSGAIAGQDKAAASAAATAAADRLKAGRALLRLYALYPSRVRRDVVVCALAEVRLRAGARARARLCAMGLRARAAAAAIKSRSRRSLAGACRAVARL